MSRLLAGTRRDCSRSVECKTIFSWRNYAEFGSRNQKNCRRSRDLPYAGCRRDPDRQAYCAPDRRTRRFSHPVRRFGSQHCVAGDGHGVPHGRDLALLDRDRLPPRRCPFPGTVREDCRHLGEKTNPPVRHSGLHPLVLCDDDGADNEPAHRGQGPPGVRRRHDLRNKRCHPDIGLPPGRAGKSAGDIHHCRVPRPHDRAVLRRPADRVSRLAEHLLHQCSHRDCRLYPHSLEIRGRVGGMRGRAFRSSRFGRLCLRPDCGDVRPFHRSGCDRHCVDCGRHHHRDYLCSVRDENSHAGS